MKLWVDAYRPKTLEEYVWRDEAMRLGVEEWLRQGALPHLLLSGPPGTGKTSLILLLLRVLEIPTEDILFIPASRERKIDDLQYKITNFIDAWTMNPSGLKYIVLDECDKLSHVSQGLLRNELESYINSTRFLMTCNYARQVIEPLHSRLQEIKFSTLNKDDFAMRAADVLDQEQVAFEPEVLLAHVQQTYPDLRKCLGVLQQNSRAGQLLPPSDASAGHDAVFVMVDLFKAGRYVDGRKLLISETIPDDYPEIFRTFYQNLDLFGATETQQTKALLAIRDASRDHSVVGDQEINMAALLTELGMIASSEG